ncbi:MAG: glycosyltransferase family 2 protein [Dysgonamonadaceae bacterium]|jgi:dolichol-phosphate mannosyltransferase|nr:glycosyltransferase family 2 protein [Dysgonamonadaceae bacterium]
MKTLTVIIPCFNEEGIIEECYTRLKAVLDTLGPGDGMLFINDGSTDRTAQRLDAMAQSDPSVSVIHFSRNFGHQAAVTAGIHHCTTDLAIIMDADLQDPPELIPQIIAKQQAENANGVYCIRRSRVGESKFKLWTSKKFYRTFNRISEMEFPLDTGDFRLIDSLIMQEFRRFKERGKYVRGLISWVGFKQVPFYYERDSRRGGESKYPVKKMLSLASTALVYFSKKPLQAATGLGFSAVLIGIILAVWYVFGKIFGYTQAESGWTSIMITILFFGGIQLLTIGVLGQYIGVLFDEVKGRPEYIIEKMVNGEPKTSDSQK